VLRHEAADQLAGVGLAVEVDAGDRLVEQGRQVEDRAGLGGAGLAFQQAGFAQ
jgi:hypothetical protein